MGTNYYRIPSVEEMEDRKVRLQRRIEEMELTPSDVERGFSSIPAGEWDTMSPWDEFTSESNIHLGKRSAGWKFLWNFHKDEYYHDLESLRSFISSGRIVNEYGDELGVEEFMQMALEWGQEDGWDQESYYKENPESRSIWSRPERYVDGLRISDSTDFS